MSVFVSRYVGDDWSFSFTYKDPDGTAINLTGFQPSAELYSAFVAAPISLTTSNGGAELLDQSVLANRGKFRILVDRDLTASLEADMEGRPRGTLAVSLTDPMGEKSILSKLPVNILGRR